MVLFDIPFDKIRQETRGERCISRGLRRPYSKGAGPKCSQFWGNLKW